MNRLVKLTSIILIQAFLFTELTWAGGLAKHNDNLSPQLLLNENAFREIYKKVREDYIVFLISTEIGSATFSRGVGYSVTEPEEKLSLEATLDYLESHPFDHKMIAYLESLVRKIGNPAIDEIMRRLEIKPNVILWGVLMNAEHSEYIFNRLKRFAERKLPDPQSALQLWLEHPWIEIRKQTQPELMAAKKLFDRIYETNRTEHIPLEQMETDIPILPHLIEKAKNMPAPVHIKQLQASVAETDQQMRTSLRKYAIDETLARIQALPLDEIIIDPVVGQGFNGTYALLINWKLDVMAVHGRNKYRIKGEVGSGGKGVIHEETSASGFMEMIERYSAAAGAMKNFPQGYVDEKKIIWGSKTSLEQQGFNALDLNELNLGFPYRDEVLSWVKAYKITADSQEEILVPMQLVFIFTNFDESVIVLNGTSSNGLASGNTLPEAKLHALFEIIERDGDYTMLYHPQRCFTLDAPVDTAIGKILDTSLKRRGITVQFLDLTTELGIPTYRAFVKVDGKVISGSGTHLNGAIAVTRAVCELNAKLAVYEKKYGLDKLSKELASQRVVTYNELPNYSTANVDYDLKLTEQLLLANGFNPIYADLTRADLNIPVVRAIVPGLDIPEGISVRQMVHLIRELNRARISKVGSLMKYGTANRVLVEQAV